MATGHASAAIFRACGSLGVVALAPGWVPTAHLNDIDQLAIVFFPL